ncbi:hypothetical protein BDZ85DRAFT_241092 [Elsinoe ampelina]|uniref:Fe2OG dioxygenase domain-containing protein n=1 Tax=Elsinoe ampelina TaxID=302913 RepID=A0A6A6G3W7_9PEZI|nr:hypothetical protein BDZ85DRAFT_241092 [Elsinoe ampelina]
MVSSGSSLRNGLEYAAILAVLAIFFGGVSLPKRAKNEVKEDIVSRPSVDRTQSLVFPDRNLDCPQHDLDIHIFSVAPLIIHISNFLTPQEADHLIDMSNELWQPSTIFNAGQEVSDDKVRKSEKAKIPRDPVVQCIESRALAFQGWPSSTFIERLWTQRYTAPDGHYAHHYDWASANPDARRSSTFMVYLFSNGTGGTTQFPMLQRPGDERWCEFVDCKAQEGVEFRPVPRSAVYWENFDSEGRGWREGLHAGMPVTSGVKIGLNIWSWYQKGLTPEQLAANAPAAESVAA